MFDNFSFIPTTVKKKNVSKNIYVGTYINIQKLDTYSNLSKLL